jgi:hypothetical protein
MNPLVKKAAWIAVIRLRCEPGTDRFTGLDTGLRLRSARRISPTR